MPLILTDSGLALSEPKTVGTQSSLKVLAASSLGSCLVFVSSAVATIALAAIGRDMGLSSLDLQWVMNAELLPLAALGNTFISLFKDTSLAAGIALAELTWQARQISTETFAVMESWITACVLYVITCTAISYLLVYVEDKLRIPH